MTLIASFEFFSHKQWDTGNVQDGARYRRPTTHELQSSNARPKADLLGEQGNWSRHAEQASTCVVTVECSVGLLRDCNDALFR